MFYLRVVGGHVLPRINLEQLPFGSLLMRAVRFNPYQPPVVHIAFLLAADVTIESLSPGQSSTSVFHFVYLISRTVAEGFCQCKTPCRAQSSFLRICSGTFSISMR